MPDRLRKMLETGATVTVRNQINLNGRLERKTFISNETSDLEAVLAQLCEQDSTVEKVYLCHPAVRYICRMDREGGFCGYRNIQMMISYISETKSDGWEHFVQGTPNILKLQDMIEEAWNQGYNSIGRKETGGIKGTRKYIGTPEVRTTRVVEMCLLTTPFHAGSSSLSQSWDNVSDALFQRAVIRIELIHISSKSCEARAYGEGSAVRGCPHERLLLAVESYFAADTTVSPSGHLTATQKLHRTSLAPIYLQHPGVSAYPYPLSLNY